MTKIHFTKAEEALEETLKKMMVDQLIQLTHGSTETEETKQAKERSQILLTLYFDLKRLHRVDSSIYKKLNLSKKTLEKHMEHLLEISSEDWQKIVHAKEKADVELKKVTKEESNEQLLKDQQTRSVHQRFNVSKRWIPLE